MPYLNDVLAHNAEVNRDAKPSGGRPSRFRFDPDEVVAQLESRIIGQPEAHRAIADLLHVVKADFAPGGRPLAVFLLVGSTGVGKTETVKVLAEAILGSADGMCRIDMNTLAQEHYAAAITGAPPGYVGSKEHHSLFQFEKVEGSYGKPGVVLFDEIEKASVSVARALLNVLDSGVLELSAGNKRLNFTNAMIFMTSNEGARELESHRRKHAAGWRRWLGIKSSVVAEKRILEKALRNKFDPEFINRIDRIIHFAAVGEAILARVLEAELLLIEKRLEKHGFTLVLEAGAREFLLRGHDPRYGARDLKRRLRVYLEPMLARFLNRSTGCGRLRVRLGADELMIEMEGG